MVDNKIIEEKVKEILSRPDFIAFLKDTEDILGQGYMVANEGLRQILRSAKQEAKNKIAKYQGDVLEWLKKNADL